MGAGCDRTIFLVASTFAVLEVRNGLGGGWPRPSLEAAIAWANMTGSVQSR